MPRFLVEAPKLRERVGEGDLKGVLNVDQIYAYCQHEHLWWKTRHKYLTRALRDYSYFGDIAKSIYTDGGKGAMIKSVEKLNDNMASRAPVRTGALRGSGGPKVFDNGALVYNRSPKVARKPGTNKGIAPHTQRSR